MERGGRIMFRDEPEYESYVFYVEGEEIYI
jgi:hypothetical protein